jgi:hypothetical protein
MTIWRIHGEAGNDSGGGDMTIFAITSGPVDFPDPHEALSRADRKHSWYNILSITQVDEFELPAAWTVFDETPLRHLIAKLEERVEAS